MDIDLVKFLKVAIQKWSIVLTATVVCGVAMFAYSKFYMKPIYASYVTMYIENTTNYNGIISSGDLDTSQSLLNTYIVLLKSNTMLEKIISKANVPYTVDQLSRMITASGVNQTQILRVTVYDGDPAEAQRIAQTVGDIVPVEIIRIVKAGNVEEVDTARLPKKPASPNIMLYTAFGCLVGLFVSCIVVILAESFDTKVKSDKDILQTLSLPVIGIIPRIKPGKGR